MISVKIDLHCHTKKCKKGDGDKRNVSRKKFIDKLNEADVGIVAITNHNHFDYEQYIEFQYDDFQVWPGIELDVQGDESKGHCILVVNPKESEKFNRAVLDVVDGKSADEFEIKIDELALKFGDFDMIAICHYGRKEPALCDNDIEKIKNALKDKVCVYCEPRNLISAGIYYAKNIYTLIGSDVKDWNNYSTSRVPELKIELDSFDHFKLLLRKDKQAIKTFLDKKKSEMNPIQPFEDKNEKLELEIFEDINVLFGGKGSGKTKILQALDEYYSTKYPNEVARYYASEKSATFDSLIDKTVRDSDFEKLNIDDCSHDINYLESWKENKISTLKDYSDWKKDKKNAQAKFGFINATFDETISNVRLNHLKVENQDIVKTINMLIAFDKKDYLSNQEMLSLNTLLTKLQDKMNEAIKNEYCKVRALELEKFTISKMKSIYRNMKGSSTKPISTGLLETYQESKTIENRCANIIKSIQTDEYVENQYIGELNENIYIYTRKKVFLDYTKANKYSKKKSLSISDSRKFKTQIEYIRRNSLSTKLNDSIKEFNEFIQEKNISSLKDMFFVNYETIKTNSILFHNDKNEYPEYAPSNGEQSMLVISHAIADDKKVYILDEPEMSVGHDYINTIILPRLRELSRNNSIVIISTHDANIAVRTLPFQSIYREKSSGTGVTYIGNPFNDEMKNIVTNDSKSWVELSLNVLEGGEQAFVEREETYGDKL